MMSPDVLLCCYNSPLSRVEPIQIETNGKRAENRSGLQIIPFFGRPLPLPVLDFRSLVLTLPFGLCGSPPATSPDSEKDSLVELRDEDLRRRRLALAFRRASWSAFSWGVQLPFTSASFSESSSSLYGWLASAAVPPGANLPAVRRVDLFVNELVYTVTNNLIKVHRMATSIQTINIKFFIARLCPVSIP